MREALESSPRVAHPLGVKSLIQTTLVVSPHKEAQKSCFVRAIFKRGERK